MPVLAVHNNILTSNTEMQNMEHHTPSKATMKTGASAKAGRRFTEEEKAQLLENFDLESVYTDRPASFLYAKAIPAAVADRVARMRSNVADILERFLIRQENEVTRIPRALRSLNVGEFADKYDGSIAACLQGMAQARLESAQGSDLAGGKRYVEEAIFHTHSILTIHNLENGKVPKIRKL
jgi:hypothetical protein